MSARLHPRPPVDPAALNGAGDTMWTNLGYWAAADTEHVAGAPSEAQARYAVAAAALAQRVGVAARLSATDVVVDYACGFGDSLRLWLEAFGARRAVGIEPDPSVCRVVEARVRSWGLSDRIRVICAAAEDISPTDADPDVTVVVCVDAAYHFSTRRTWLAHISAGSPGGLRVGLADLCTPEQQTAALRLRALARLMGIPRANLVSARSIAMDCEDAGFTVTSCDDVATEVLDGFVAHAPRGAWPVAVTRAAIAYARRAALLDYCVIAATR